MPGDLLEPLTVVAATLPGREVVLRTGATARLRPVGPDDSASISAFFDALSDESRMFRFFTGGVDIARAAAWAAHADGVERYGLLAVTAEPERLIGHGVYVRTGPASAELAFEVAEDRRGEGLATQLLMELARVAARAGITTFTASVLAANHEMLAVFRDSGFPVKMRADHGTLEVELPTISC